MVKSIQLPRCFTKIKPNHREYWRAEYRSDVSTANSEYGHYRPNGPICLDRNKEDEIQDQSIERGRA